MKAIAISGIPGTGKTTLAKKLAKALDIEYLDVNKVIKENPKTVYKINKKLDTKEIDLDELIPILERTIKKNKKQLIIDSHLSHYLPKKYIKVCIITKCELKELKKRLTKRKYKDNKIRENLDSEIFDICLMEALENKHRVIITDTTEGIDIKSIISNLK